VTAPLALKRQYAPAVFDRALLGGRSTSPLGFAAAMDTSSLLWGLLFGSIGLGFFVYGRRQKAVVPLACGVALMIFPYFVSNTILLVLLGVALIAIPYFVRI
jgi:predicted membrane protein